MTNNNFTTKAYTHVISMSILMTATTYTLTWYYDTKWSLPIVVWSLIIVGAARPAWQWLYILQILSLLGWVYLWLVGCGFLMFKRLWVTVALALLLNVVIETGLSVLRQYDYQVVFDKESSWFYIPSTFFMLGSLLLIYTAWLVRKR